MRSLFDRRTVLRRAGASGLAVLLGACARAFPPDLGRLIEQASTSLVGVGDSAGVAGTGFHIEGSRFVATAAHVVHDLKAPLHLRTPRGTVNARVARMDAAADLALLEARSPGQLAVGLKLAPAPASIGEWALVLGCPFGAGPTATLGIVSALPGAVREPPVLARRLQLNAAVNPGNSGGPVINLRGQVIGVANATVPGGYGLGFAVPVQDLMALLQA